jgi:uncharacterized protein (TIGR00297 family)
VSTILNAQFSIPLTDWLIATLGFSCVILILLLTEATRKHLNIAPNLTRKFIHITTGLIICLVAAFSSSNLPILIFAFLYIFIDIWALIKGKFKSIHPDFKSLGTVFYAFSVFLLAFVLWGEYKPLFIMANLIMVVPDAFAAIVGEKYAKEYFIPLEEKKSLIGAATMFSSTVLIIVSILPFYYSYSWLYILFIAITVGIIATVAELLSVRGSDNLSVPFLSAVFLFVFLIHPDAEIAINILFGILASLLVAIVSYKVNFLNVGGALLTFLMGCIIFGLGGWSFTIPILIFFILSSLLSKFGKSRKKMIELSYQKTSVRDFYQVMANGGVATVLVLFIYLSGNNYLYPLYLAAIAAANADTWGTELGIFSKSRPVVITSFKRVDPGTSGAISIIGSVAALTGSLLIVVIGTCFYSMEWNIIVIVVLGGYLGSVFDSFIGATVQGQFRCQKCGQNTESRQHCGLDTVHVKGKIWVDNDLVNIFSILIAVAITFILLI